MHNLFPTFLCLLQCLVNFTHMCLMYDSSFPRLTHEVKVLLAREAFKPEIGHGMHLLNAPVDMLILPDPVTSCDRCCSHACSEAQAAVVRMACISVAAKFELHALTPISSSLAGAAYSCFSDKKGSPQQFVSEQAATITSPEELLAVLPMLMYVLKGRKEHMATFVPLIALEALKGRRDQWDAVLQRCAPPSPSRICMHSLG